MCTVSYGKVRCISDVFEILNLLTEKLFHIKFCCFQVKLVLKQNKYFVESSHPEVLQTLLKDAQIQECRLRRSGDSNQFDEITISKTSGAATLNSAFSNVPAATRTAEQMNQAKNGEDGSNNGQEGGNGDGTPTVVPPSDITDYYSKMDADNDEEEEEKVVAFEVLQEKIEILQKRCIELEYPLLAEYDFRNDTRNPDIK